MRKEGEAEMPDGTLAPMPGFMTSAADVQSEGRAAWEKRHQEWAQHELDGTIYWILTQLLREFEKCK